MNTDTIRQPNGPTSRAWHYQGYQAAMRDIEQMLKEGGEERVREWVNDNLIQKEN